jgi:hypothetical protein
MNRKEHLDWCKERALEYVERNDIPNAFGSFICDMKKHEETADHIALDMGMGLVMNGFLSTSSEMKKFIEDFN